jgi:hypothetical protein
MKISKFWIALISGIAINMFMGSRGFAQCDEIVSNYQRYLISHSLNLDPIEGKWKAYRTVKIYQDNHLKRITKDGYAETWAIFKKDNSFIVCTGNNELNIPDVFFTKEQNLKYVFNKNYVKQKSFVSAYANLIGDKLVFAFSENVAYLMELLGPKFKSGISIQYEYELVKEVNYTTKVTNQVPKIKNFIIEGVKDYFNL